MILTERQKNILALFITGQKISVKEIEQRVGISRRTVYREFTDLRNILNEKKLDLISEKGKYFLNGDRKELLELRKQIQETPGQISLGVEERERALAVLLLLTDEPQKIITFALDLNVSEATVQNDLNSIKNSLAKYKIELSRVPGVGVSVKTTEYQRRQILIGILLSEINDYTFFHYLNHDDAKNDNFFLSLFSKEELLKTRSWLEEAVFNNINLDSDHQIIELILTFALSLMRIKAGHPIKNLKPAQGTLKYEGLVFKVMSLAVNSEKIKVSQADVIYLANKLKSCDNEKVTIQYDNDQDIATSIKVKRLVKEVSEQTHWNFQKDPNFVNRLNKHIIGLLQHRVTPLPNVRIETLAGLSQRFDKLYNAIKKAWSDIFTAENISKSEMQLLLLYFANEYTNAVHNQEFTALVICENGIGTSAILKTRLKKELPEIKHIQLSKVADLAQIDLKNYDLILSTLELKGFSRKYQLVSPLLLDDEIARIRTYLKDYEKKFPPIPVTEKQTESIKATETLSEISIGTFFCSELVNSIKVQRLTNNATDLIAVVQECLNYDDGVLRDKTIIAQKILERIKLAPVGIPNSQLALLHTSSSEVKRCSFMVFDLDNEITLKAMDQTDIAVKRILLMLGPAQLSESEQSVMSMISSMIIMNDVNFKLFTDGDQQQIKNAISAEYLRELKTKL